MSSLMTQEEHKKIQATLLDLVIRAEAEAAFLCDHGGNILAQSTTEQYMHEENIAALAAGSFYATRELARLIGEPEFRYIFHRGDKTSIYMQNTARDMLLMVVFGKESNPGLVKLYADETSRELEAVLQDMADPSRQRQIPSPGEIKIDDTRELFKRASGPNPR